MVTSTVDVIVVGAITGVSKMAEEVVVIGIFAEWA